MSVILRPRANAFAKRSTRRGHDLAVTGVAVIVAMILAMAIPAQADKTSDSAEPNASVILGH